MDLLFKLFFGNVDSYWNAWKEKPWRTILAHLIMLSISALIIYGIAYIQSLVPRKEDKPESSVVATTTRLKEVPTKDTPDRTSTPSADLKQFTPAQLEVILKNCDYTFDNALIAEGGEGIHDESGKKICLINGTQVIRNGINIFIASSTKSN